MWEMRDVGLAGPPGWPLVGVDESVGSWLPQVGSRSSGRVRVLLEGVGMVLRSQVGKHQVHVY